LWLCDVLNNAQRIKSVIPAAAKRRAGIQELLNPWIPAFAGMTKNVSGYRDRSGAVTMSYIELAGLVVGAGIVAALICGLLHRIVHRDRFRRYHEVGYAVFLQLGVIFAVLLAFVFNNVWSNYNVASQAIDSECGSLHGIAILGDRLPSPARDAILNDLHAYLTTVIDREWADM
jgi:hypothetical protein